MKTIKQLTLALFISVGSVQAGDYLPSDITPLESLGFCAGLSIKASQEDPDSKPLKEVANTFESLYNKVATDTYPDNRDLKEHVNKVIAIVRRELAYIESRKEKIKGERERFEFEYDYGYNIGRECVEDHLKAPARESQKPREWTI